MSARPWIHPRDFAGDRARPSFFRQTPRRTGRMAGGGRAARSWRGWLAAIAASWLGLTAGVASGQLVPVANGSFELGGRPGDKMPAGWVLSGGEGFWGDGPAPHGRRTLGVRGTGGDANYWRSASLALEPGGLYELSFLARSTARTGTPTTGPLFCNRDLGPIAAAWGEYRSVFVAPASVDSTVAWLRFGQWQTDGEVEYDRIELRRARPLYARTADLELGDGETLAGDTYTCVVPGMAVGSNHSRPLVAHRAHFNTYRWCLGAGSYVTYCHRVGSRRQLEAAVAVSVGYHEAGTLRVEASADGATWTLLGELAEAGAGTFAVPASLLPAAAIWVRLGADAPRRLGPDFDPGALQVTEYRYTARVDGTPADLRGATRFLAVETADERLAVDVCALGDALPGGDNRLVLALANLGSAARTVQPQATIEARHEPQVGGAAAPTAAGGRREGQGGPARAEVRSRVAAVSPVRLEPGARDTVTLEYQVPGAGDWDLQVRLEPGRAFAGRLSVAVPALYASSYGQRLPGSTDALGLWWASSGWKIARQRPVPETPGPAVRISAARGEAEAAQLVIRPQAELDDLTVQATALAGPQQAVIPASAVELLQVGYVSIERPSDPTGAVAGWPDPLLPLAEPLRVPGGANQPIWVRVRVPHDAPAGTYHGELLVQAAGRQVRVPLQVVAFDFDLPARMSCSTAFGFSWPLVVRYQRLRNEADQRAVLDKYLASFAAHHISPYDPAPMDPLRVAWEGLAPRFDWAAWDGAVRRGLDTLGFNSFELPVSGLGGGTFHSRREPELNGHPEGSPEYEAMLAAYLGSLEQHLRERGWLDAAYVYWFDEPEPRDYAFVMNGFRKLRTHAPGIRRMLTEQVEPELIGGPTIWCPVTSSFEPGPAAARQQAGETIWWYVCTGPKAPYAGLFIDHPGTELRVWLWQTWQHQVQGILVWQTNYWTSSAAYPDSLQDPYADPMSWVSGYDSRPGARIPWGNGDGRFVYPPLAAIRGAGAGPVLDGPVESIRWEMLRDGIEDYEYFAMLRALLQRRADLPAGLRASYERLLEVPAAVSASMTEFTRDPGTIEAHRQALAQAIEALSR